MARRGRKCRIIRVPKQGNRRICWSAKGKITSNKPAGGGRRRRRRRRR